MTSPMTNSQHLDPERLSDLIDDRLEPAERGSADAHLVGCSPCASELASLRATVALLRGLPEPVLPRSFHLAASARPALLLRLVTWTRAAGALAAALFVVLVSAELLA